MSIVGKLLGFTGLPQWAMELLAVVLVCAGVLAAYAVWHHKVYQQGIHAAVQAEKAASDKMLAAVQKHNAAVVLSQQQSDQALEAKNATLQASNLALADSVAVGLRNAYHDGQARALSSIGSASSPANGAAASGADHASSVPDLTPLLVACAEDDATLTGLQAWAKERLIVFQTKESPHALSQRP